jgi:hypothetical protein
MGKSNKKFVLRRKHGSHYGNEELETITYFSSTTS